MPKATYGNYKFDFEETPWDQPLSGEDIKKKVRDHIGENPEGSPYVMRNDGTLEHVSADEKVHLGPNDRVGFTGQFETAS